MHHNLLEGRVTLYPTLKNDIHCCEWCYCYALVKTAKDLWHIKYLLNVASRAPFFHSKKDTGVARNLIAQKKSFKYTRVPL